MPTSKNRINITVDDDLFAALDALATRRKKSLSSLSMELIARAMELEEDLHFSVVADERYEKSKGKKRYAHDEVWKK